MRTPPPDVTLAVVERLVLEEDDRVVVADRLDQEALRLVRRGRANDIQARDVGDDGVEHLASAAPQPEPGADHRPNHDRRLRLAAEHVAELGRLVEDLVEAHAHEVDEHQLGHRAEAAGRGADRGPDDRRTLDRRRVEHPLPPVLPRRGPSSRRATPPQASVSPGAAGPTDDVLAHEDDALDRGAISCSSASLIAWLSVIVRAILSLTISN